VTNGLNTADILCRVSTEAQAAADAISYDQQEANCRRWCEANGFRVRQVRYEAKSADPELDPDQRQLRPEFWAAWDDLKAGEIQALIFNDRTRVVRESASYSYYLQLARKHGQGIVVVESAYDNLQGWQRKALVALDGLAAEADNESRKLVFFQKKTHRFEQGQLAQGRLPLGYHYNKELRKAEVDKGAAELVSLIYDLYATEGLSIVKVAGRLREMGAPTPSRLRGHKGAKDYWDLSVLHGILKREAYTTGIVKMPFRGEVYEIPVPPIIERHVFDRGQYLLKTRRRVRWSNEKRLLSGRINCVCGRPYYRGTWWRKRAKATVPCYYCKGRNRPLTEREGTALCHESPILWADDVEDLLWNRITALLTDGNGLKEAAEQHLARVEEQIAAISLGPTEERIQELQHERVRWMEAWVKFKGEPQTRRLPAWRRS